MKLKTNILRIGIYTLGVLCLAAFVITQTSEVPKAWLHPDLERYGSMNFVEQFRVELPPELPKYRDLKKNPEPAEADILTFGDSFFDFSRQKTFPERLADTLGLKVSYTRRRSPLQALANMKYERTAQRKLVIVEIVERNIPEKFSEPHPVFEGSVKVSSRLNNVVEAVFSPRKEEMYGFLLERSVLTHKAYRNWATWKFEHLGYISHNTPKYVIEPPFLFYHQTVNEKPTSFYYQHSTDEIETYCNNIADLAAKLDSLYNLEMVFMPVPNKYTVHHHLLNNDTYNQFLPAVMAGLEARKIPVLNVYEPFMQSDEILYYGTDTHWNQRGVDVALDVFLHSPYKAGGPLK